MPFGKNISQFLPFGKNISQFIVSYKIVFVMLESKQIYVFFKYITLESMNDTMNAKLANFVPGLDSLTFLLHWWCDNGIVVL